MGAAAIANGSRARPATSRGRFGIAALLHAAGGNRVFVTLLAKLREWASEEALGRDPYCCDTAGTLRGTRVAEAPVHAKGAGEIG